MCVGFLYTLVVRRPSGSLKTAVFRKDSLLSFSVSMVKRMEGCWLFRCGRSQLVRPKDAVDPAKQDGVVYRIACECGKVYIGETGRPMQDRIKEHDRDIRLACTETSAVSEHDHNTGHKPLWNEVK